MDRLFVYGTLGPDRPNAHILESIGGSWSAATVTGILRKEGWGAEMGYPGIDLGDGDAKESKDTVEGFLFTSENLANHWDVLDRFEGEQYQRVITSVTLPDGRITEAFIYCLST